MNHNYEDDVHESEPYADDAQKTKGFWAGLLTGLPLGWLAGALSGALVGAGAMFLLAPHSGKKTRAKLLRQGRDLRDQAEESMGDAADQARDDVQQMSHDLRRQAKKLERRGQELFDGQKET
jgi:gas vesicle protein